MSASEQGGPTLPYGRHWIDEEDIGAVADVLRGDWITQGPTVGAFEAALAEACGAKHAVAVSSGTAALHLACLAADLGPGDVGVTSPITFVASANAVAYCGARPAFVDVDSATITLDPTALRAFCERERPRAIIPVDFAGQPADLPAIRRIADDFGALVIEDAAHSLGASYVDQERLVRAASCTHTDMAVLSFHPVKHIATGEGGAILTMDDRLAARLRSLRTHGITKDPARLIRRDGPWYHEQHELGFNYRITDFQCALGLSQMRRLPAFVARRRELVERYARNLRDRSGRVGLLLERPSRLSSYHLLVALFSEGAVRRRQAYDALAGQGIAAQVHYFPVHLQPWYREHFGFAPGAFPNSERYYEQCLSLPLFPRMADTDVDRVCDVLSEVLDGNP